MSSKRTLVSMQIPSRLLLLGLLPGSMLISCASYEVDSASDQTLVGSISKAINTDRGRKQKETETYDQAPIYVDYSKSNPLLRHDDEFDEDQKIEKDDPFEEEVEFSDLKKLKQKRQAKRSMEEDHEIRDAENGPISFW